MNCSKCGTEIVEGAKFCTSCSNRVDNMVVCPVCETENDKNFTFCFACGSRLDGKRFCKNCNTEILENYTFCPVCGERVSVVFNPSIKHGKVTHKKMIQFSSDIDFIVFFISTISFVFIVG